MLDRGAACFLRIPSVIVALPDADDRNILVNHGYDAKARIVNPRVEPFTCNPQLLVSAWAEAQSLPRPPGELGAGGGNRAGACGVAGRNAL